MRWGVLAQMSSHSQGFSSLQTIDLSNPVAKQFIQENTSTEPVNSSSLSFAFHEKIDRLLTPDSQTASF